MTEFWEEAFKDKQEMWGLEPAKPAIMAKDFFVEHHIKSVLIPGIGYGRNAQIFMDNGMTVTGIEISQTAIDLARKYFGNDLTIHHGTVTEMPFDDKLYEGIFCYGLIYLLNKKERKKLIQDCFNQLTENGFMIFTTITKTAKTYGLGIQISKDRFEMFGGVKIFFYDKETIDKITVPQETDKLILSFIGMEETTIKLKQDCDTVEVVMIYNGTYDFMTSRKIDRLRFKRFKKLPELRKVAHEKGVFLNEYQCYEQDFVPIKPRLDRIKKDRKKLAPEISE